MELGEFTQLFHLNQIDGGLAMRPVSLVLYELLSHLSI